MSKVTEIRMPPSPQELELTGFNKKSLKKLNASQRLFSVALLRSPWEAVRTAAAKLHTKKTVVFHNEPAT